MAIHLQITADGPAALAELWGHLGGQRAEVDIRDEDMFIFVDLCAPSAEVDPGDTEADTPEDTPESDSEDTPAAADDPEPDEGTPDEPEPAAQVDDEPQVDAEVVSIDSKARERHPAKAAGEVTCAEAVIAVLAAEPDVQFTIMEIVDSIDGHKESTIKFTIAQLTRDGKIARAGRGLYQAAN